MYNAFDPFEPLPAGHPAYVDCREVRGDDDILRDLGADRYRNLSFNRCLLEYRYFDSHENMQRWYDVHPLIKGIPEFKEALAKLPTSEQP